MKKIILVILLLCVSLVGYAQTPTLSFPFGSGGGGDDIVKIHDKDCFNDPCIWRSPNTSDQLRNAWYLYGAEEFKLSFVPVKGIRNDSLSIKIFYQNFDWANGNQLLITTSVKVNGVSIATTHVAPNDSTLVFDIATPQVSFIEITFNANMVFYNNVKIRGELWDAQVGPSASLVKYEGVECGEHVTPGSFADAGEVFVGGYHDNEYYDFFVVGSDSLERNLFGSSEQFRLWYVASNGDLYQKRVILGKETQVIQDTISLCDSDSFNYNEIRTDLGIQLYKKIQVPANQWPWEYAGFYQLNVLDQQLVAGQTYWITQFQDGTCTRNIQIVTYIKKNLTLQSTLSCNQVILTVPGCTGCNWVVNSGTPVIAESLVLADSSEVSVSFEDDSTCFSASYSFDPANFGVDWSKAFVEGCNSVDVSVPTELELLSNSITVVATDTIVTASRTATVSVTPETKYIEIVGEYCDSTYTRRFYPRYIFQPSVELEVASDCGQNVLKARVRDALKVDLRVESLATDNLVFNKTNLSSGDYTWPLPSGTGGLEIDITASNQCFNADGFKILPVSEATAPTLDVVINQCRDNVLINSNQGEVIVKKTGTSGSKIIAEADSLGNYVPLSLDPGEYQFTAGTCQSVAKTLVIEEDQFDPTTMLSFVPTDSTIRVFIDRSLLPAGSDSVYVTWNGNLIATTYYDLEFNNQGMLEVFVGSISCGFRGQKVLIPALVCLGKGLGVDTNDTPVAPSPGELKVYPVPVSQTGTLTIESPQMSISKAVLYSLTGLNLWTSRMNNWMPWEQGNKTQVNLAPMGLSVGIYLLRMEWIESGKLYTKVEKVIVQ
jgi:hypothetical protein